MNRIFALFVCLFFLLLTSPLKAQSTSSGITPCGAGLSISASSVSSNTLLSNCGGVAVVWNTGTAEVFLNWGTASNTAATTSGWSLPGGAAIELNTGKAPLYLAAITSSSTSTLRVVQGNGGTALAGGGATGGGSGAAVSIADCADVAEGCKADSAWVSGSGTVIAILKNIANGIASAIAAGTNYIGQVGLNPVTSGGLSMYTANVTASDNHANIKNSAGQVYNISAYNNNAAANYIRLYNAASGFNACNSATNLVWSGIIPGATTGAGFNLDIANGVAFSTGISICVSGAFGNTDTTNAVTNTSVNIGFK